VTPCSLYIFTDAADEPDACLHRPTLSSSLSTHPSLPLLFSQNRSASAECLFVKCYILEEDITNLLKPTGYLMYQHF
jgi:hypothetical protein